MVWNRWSKLVTNARTQDTGVVVGDETELEKVASLAKGKASFNCERGVVKYACGLGMRYECA